MIPEALKLFQFQFSFNVCFSRKKYRHSIYYKNVIQRLKRRKLQVKEFKKNFLAMKLKWEP